MDALASARRPASLGIDHLELNHDVALTAGAAAVRRRPRVDGLSAGGASISLTGFVTSSPARRALSPIPVSMVMSRTGVAARVCTANARSMISASASASGRCAESS